MKYYTRALVLAALFVSPLPSQADIKLPALFGTHMVIQAGIKAPVWGTADPGEAVTVTVGKETAKTTADSSGKWKVEIGPMTASSTPVTLTAAGKNTITLEDVLIGEVWVCSGQSNMEFGIGMEYDASQEIAKASNPMLRLFCVPKALSVTPLDEIGGIKPDAPQGHWQICTPETLAKDGTWSGFSAVGYFFGRDLQKSIGQPVGLIASDWGGTRAEAWTSLSGLQKEPSEQNAVVEQEKNAAAFAKMNVGYEAKVAAYNQQLAGWMASVATANKALADWMVAAKAAKAANQPLPPKPAAAPAKPAGPPDPHGGANGPANLYNAMISPLIPFAIKGVIWYQGESNAAHAKEYRTVFSRMITDWREKWGQGDFAFLFVELASFRNINPWPLLRESQRQTLSLPKTGMATAVDVGNPTNIHPQDKLDVGKRLALVARHVAYGEDLVYCGPVYKAMESKGSAISVSFTSEGGGLIIGSAPWVAPGFKPLPTASLLGFTIAGEDKKWVAAVAKIEGDAVVVSSAEVPHPVAVRYDWDSAPEGNLYNKEGLPASPFRTDDWVDPLPQPAKSATPAQPSPSPK